MYQSFVQLQASMSMQCIMANVIYNTSGACKEAIQ